MTKGKYAAKAAMRRAEIEATAGLETYKRRVADLTAENKGLKERLVEKDRAHSKEVRLLKAERDEGTSPTLRAVEAECQRLRERADLAERELRLKREQGSRGMRRLIGHFATDHGMGEADAIEAALPIYGKFGADVDGEGDIEDLAGRAVTLDHNPSTKKLSKEQIKTLQRVRGERR